MQGDFGENRGVKHVGLGEDIARQIIACMKNGFMTGSIVYLDGDGLVV